jgi:hypothetical protein
MGNESAPAGAAPPGAGGLLESWVAWSTGQWAVDKAKQARASAAETLDAATESLTIARDLKAAFGVAPNPVMNIPGTGIVGAFVVLSGKVDSALEKLDELVTDIAADRKARNEVEATRNAALLWAAKIVGGALLIAAVGGLLGYLSGFHR